MNTTPRIREDLQATATEDGGIPCFDVKDPRSGGTMRLYHFEWLIAQRMDGRQSLDDVAAWARAQFGGNVSSDDLSVYADRLKELGFVDESSQPHAAPAVDMRRPSPPDEPIVVVDEPARGREPSAPRALQGEEPSIEIEISQGSLVEVNDEKVAKPEPPIAVEEPKRPVEPPPPVFTPPPRAVTPPRVTAAPPVEHREPAHVAKPSPATPEKVATVRPLEPAQPVTPPQKSKALTYVLVLLLAGAAGFAGYWYLLAPGMQAVPVSAQAAPAPSTVVRYYDKDAKIDRAAPVALSFGEGGTITEIAANGTKVEQGAPVAVLDTYAPVEKELTDVRERLSYYTDHLKTAQAKGKTDEAKQDEKKVAEKKKRLAELEDKATKTRALAPSAGTVSDVTLAVGAQVKPGDVAAKLSDDRTMAEFALAPGDAGSFKVGQSVTLHPAAGADFAGKVAAVGPASVKVEIPASASVKAGDSVQLLKAQIVNAIAVPSSAVTKSQGGADEVFVVTDGVAHAHTVTVADRDGQQALVTSGVNPGDQVLVKFPADLQDGQKVSTGQPQ